MSTHENRKRKMANELSKLTNGQKGERSTFQRMVLDMPTHSKRTRKSVIFDTPSISQQLSNSGIIGAIVLDNMKKSSIIASETTNETTQPNLLNILVKAALTLESIPENTTLISIPVVSVHPGLTSTISSSSGSTPIVISNAVSRNITSEQNGENSSDSDTNKSEIQNITVSSADTLRTSSASAIKISDKSPQYDLKSLAKIVKTNHETILRLKIKNIMLRMDLVELKINKLKHDKKKKWDDYLNNFKNRSEQGFQEKQKKLKNELIYLFKNIANCELEKEYLTDLNKVFRKNRKN